MSRTSIRSATERDAESIAQLSGTLGYAVTADVMRERLRTIVGSSSDLLIVAVDSNDQVLGWLQAHAANVIESGFRVEIMGLIVSPEQRRSGIGRLLVHEAERWASSLSATAIVVRSNVQRTESHAFYPALGYALTKSQKVYRKILATAIDH
jgi:predicted N-acetyltransferase YhbS